MKRYIINSTDNTDYALYWPYIKAAWEKFGFTPILIRVGFPVIECLNNTDISILDLPAVQDVSIVCQAQVARWYACKFFPDDLVMTSDIDMMPLQCEYFEGSFDLYEEWVKRLPALLSNYLLFILSYDAFANDPGMNQYPICYNIAKGKVFAKLLNCYQNWDSWIKSLSGYGYGWSTDQALFYNCLQEKPRFTYLRNNRGWDRQRGEAHNRIDRNTWVYDEGRVRAGGYIDAHLPRPFHEKKGEIEKLFKLIME